MSSDWAVEARHLGKHYVIQHQRAVLMQELFKRLFGSVQEETFWALRDVSFAIPKGRAVGIVGRNGSGKSTLLKILNRVTPPTAGEVEIHGRVVALLELGAGFHYNLTGRENIYLNASILGLSQDQIDSRFERIVAFSGIERFIDVPVRSYSSGMFVRLGFSVAVHLDADVLIFDEVLAVGDEAFQEKCMAKIREFQQAGKTILFVSHSMEQVKQVCQDALLLDQGRVVLYAEAGEVAEHYHQLQRSS